jgi:hypothetical protein
MATHKLIHRPTVALRMAMASAASGVRERVELLAQTD